MKTLIIHPLDSTTNFLSGAHIGSATIVRTDIGQTLLKGLIEAHERIVMLGHGTDEGLIGFGDYVIDDSFVEVLKGKDCVCVWCYASDFVQKHDLKSSFSTGMFISDLDEARQMKVECTPDQLHDSNYYINDALESFLLNPKATGDDLKHHYLIGGVSPIVAYNADLFRQSL